MAKRLVIGFGTGRSGTTSLSAFLNAQPGVSVFHEGRLEERRPAHPFAWTGDEDNILAWIGGLYASRQPFSWIGDIGMYYVNYVHQIHARYPDTRFICMQRSMDEVVSSYMRWTEAKNHWMVHDGLVWQLDDKWDKAYPKYDVKTKQEALEQYWKEYQSLSQQVLAEFPDAIKIVDIHTFNEPACRDEILDFIGYTGPRYTQMTVHRNSLKDKHRERFGERIIGQVLTMKRFFIGRPGNRWYKRKHR